MEGSSSFFADPKFWVAVSFVLFFVLLGSKLWKAGTGALDSRADGIRKRIDEANKLRVEAEAKLKEAEAARAEAVKEAAELLARAKTEAARIAAAAAAGAKRAVRLQVSIASHSPLMEEAAAGMRAALESVTVHDPKITMLANANAAPIRTAAELRRELSDHLTTGVDWIAAIGATAAAGTERYVEIGYGRVLSGLVKRIPSAAGAEIVSIDDLPLTAAVVS